MKNILLALFLIGQLFLSVAYCKKEDPTILRVQLPWMHSSQFAGLYVDQVRKHFEKEGLEVRLIEGGPDINPVKEVQDGRADIAITKLVTAWELAKRGNEVTNIAQIIQGSGVVVVCRISAGVYKLERDLAGKRIGIFDSGDRMLIQELIGKYSIPNDAVTLINQKEYGLDMVNKNVDCATGLIFSEYLSMIDQGIPYSDLLVIDTNKAGVPVLLDGVYVSARKLESEEFRSSLVGFLRALREGWQEVRVAPSLSLEAVRSFVKDFNKQLELKSLESILALIPTTESEFGLLRLENLNREAGRYAKNTELNDYTPQNLWTHQIWNQLRREDGDPGVFTFATKYYVDHISHFWLFKLMVYFGVFTYALSGVLEAIQRRYDLWGRTVLAFLSGIGGGTIRDLIIGGGRIPFYYVRDYHYPLGIFSVVVLSSLLVWRYPNAYESTAFKSIKKYSDVLGFSCLAVAGAIYAIVADMQWFWVPVLGALTCAGGGALRDIVINQEPHTFRGVIYEEAAVLGGIFIILGLLIANRFEHYVLPVYVTIFGALALIILLRLAIYKYDLRYPKSMGGGVSPSH